MIRDLRKFWWIFGFACGVLFVSLCVIGVVVVLVHR